MQEFALLTIHLTVLKPTTFDAILKVFVVDPETTLVLEVVTTVPIAVADLYWRLIYPSPEFVELLPEVSVATFELYILDPPPPPDPPEELSPPALPPFPAITVDVVNVPADAETTISSQDPPPSSP